MSSLPAPAPPPPPRFPVIALVAPLVLSALLFLLFRSSYLLIFALLGPVMALSSWWEARRTYRADMVRHQVAERERTEEAQAYEQRRNREELVQLEARFPHPTQWADLPLWRPQRDTGGPAIRIGCGSRNGSTGNALVGAPMVAHSPRGIALVGPAGLTECCWPALAASVAIHQSRRKAWPLGTWWPEEGRPGALLEVVTSESEAMVVQRCEDDAAVDERVDNVLRAVSPGYAQWFQDGVMVSDALRLDQVSVHETLRIRQFLGQWFPSPPDHREAPPEPSRDNLVLSWSATGWRDLVRAGPHAVVWGQSGSGKTVLMNTLIRSISHRYRPEEVQVVVVDFKGGSGIAAIDDLPHLVGVISDLDGPLIPRALRGIGAEVRRRERLLRDHRAADLSSLPQSVHCPRTLLVIDEVGALIHQHPEWEALLGDLASRGRALGLHLLLIGQRVSGQVPRSVLANASLRMCLRIGDASEASDLLPGASATDIGALVSAKVGTVAVSDGQQVVVGAVEPLPDLSARPGVGAPLWLPPLPQRAEGTVAGGLALMDDPEHQSQSKLRIEHIPRGLVVVIGDSGAGHSTLLSRWAGEAGGNRSDVLPADPIGFTERLVTLVRQRTQLPSLVAIDRLDRICRGQSENFREWVAELIQALSQLIADQATSSHLVVTVAPGNPEERGLRRLQSSAIHLRQALADHSLLAQNSVPPADAPPGRIYSAGLWGQVFIPSDDVFQEQPGREAAPLPTDALVVCQEIDDTIACDNVITLAQADERFFDLERAYRSSRLVLVGVAGDALRALRIPPVPATASPVGWLLGPANISVVRVGGSGTLEDRINADRVETESLADRTIGQ